MERRKIVFDLDGTLTNTRKNFNDHVNIAIEGLLQFVPGMTHESLLSTFRGHMDVVHREVQVHPYRLWRGTINRLRSEYELPREACDTAMGIMMSSYLKIPELFPDVVPALSQLQKMMYEMYICSHAELGWVLPRVLNSELAQFIPAYRIAATDVTQPKDHNAWRLGLHELEIVPQQAIVAGDGIKQDIISAGKAGVGKLYYVRRDVESWHIFSSGEIPPELNVTEVADILQLVEHELSGGN